jgi:ArsR family transcriptional regulator
MSMGRREPLDDANIVRVLKALADPTRFRMVQEIATAGELSCGEVQEHFDVSQPTISHHMKILSDAGVLIQRIDGKHRYTSVDAALVRSVLDAVPPRLTVAPKKRTAANTR